MPTFSYDFNPESQTVSTGNYTVAANKYVQCSAVASGTALVVGGTTIMLAHDEFITDNGGGTGTTGAVTTYTNSNSYSVIASVGIRVTGGTYTNFRVELDDGSREGVIADFNAQYGSSSSLSSSTGSSLSQGMNMSSVVVGPGQGLLLVPIGGGGSPAFEYAYAATANSGSPPSITFFAPTGQTINGGRKIISVFPE